ncbi:Uncharacterised protein [Enterobacter hormaechei]|uniref:hypothetical protein n=1 Tax=Enterobacter hormaechei TaxID=158836 RepID=UPI000793000D|nr:hypothetical protein [Enterobacter hormaechei]CZW99370.1 Uncharacterised protein [Enterobacter hormaechei]VAC26591.1 Uncharacterised protein [Enterobacter hormaechei]
MKQKFIEWFTKNNNGCSPAMEDDRSFVYETTQLMFEAYQAGVTEGEAKCAAMAAENVGLKSVDVWMNADEVGGSAADKAIENGATPEEATRAGVQAVIESIKTPATDAFLAEVQAQGVEMFALMFAEEAIKGSNTTGWKAKASRAASEYAEALREDAAQLRKGVQS